MRRSQPLPLLWLLSDARNDNALETALDRLPRRSGFVFRHYHLSPAERQARFEALAAIARSGNHLVILADTPDRALEWGADGVYGQPDAAGAVSGLLRLAAAHDGSELQQANAAQADGVFLSPVFATASHPGAATLGVHGFHVLAQQSAVPVIALGGMTQARAIELDWPRWGAIDAFSNGLA